MLYFQSDFFVWLFLEIEFKKKYMCWENKAIENINERDEEEVNACRKKEITVIFLAR